MGTRSKGGHVLTPVLDPPINLSDLSISRSGSAASQASYDLFAIAPLHTFTVGTTGTGKSWVLRVPRRAINAEWLRPTVNSVIRALSLPRGWDTYDALPISHRSAEGALTFLATVIDPDSAPPAVVPLADGGVQVEWHRGGLDVEIAFSPNEEPEIYVADQETGNEWDLTPYSESFEEIQPLLARLRV
jgi:hypothetical protein